MRSGCSHSKSLGVPLYNYNSSNELTANSLGNYTYDANGNTISDSSGKNYTWDFENRMVSATVPGSGAVSFKYDPFGRRIQKGGPSGTTNYLYDGANLLGEVDNSGSVLSKYTFGGLDQPLSELRSGSTSFYEADELDSITSLSNATGALSNTYSYDSFGKRTASTGTLVNPFQYTGREFDSETGLVYYRARYYDPSSGRFLNEDPLGFGSDVNFYPYVGNSPIIFTAPSGKSAGAAVGLAPIFSGGVSGTEVGGSMAGPIGALVGLNVGLLINDSIGAYDLGVAYGWWDSQSETGAML